MTDEQRFISARSVAEKYLADKQTEPIINLVFVTDLNSIKPSWLSVTPIHLLLVNYFPGLVKKTSQLQFYLLFTISGCTAELKRL